MDEADLQVINDVAEFGWHVILVPEEEETPAFAFSIGLLHTFKHPEILVVGLPIDTMHQIINGIGESVRAGTTFTEGQRSSEVLADYDCTFVKVAQKYYDDYLGYAQWFYHGKDFPTLQCVWPDREHRYPWHAEAAAWFRTQQPVLASE